MARRAFGMIGLLLVALLIFTSCGQSEDELSSLKDLQPEPAEATAPQERPVSSSPSVLTAQVKIVDLEGKPLAGMLPIVVDQPNAFNPPVNAGQPTSSEGATTVEVPNQEWLYMRAWDPQQRYFANNYYDLVPGGSVLEETMTLIMAPAAALSTRLLAKDGSPFTGKSVGLMLLHPELGPWWPSESATDAEGNIQYDTLPPGKYLLRFEVETGEQCELPEFIIMPGETTELPPVLFP